MGIPWAWFVPFAASHTQACIWKVFLFGNVFICLLQAVSSIVYRRKENAITGIIIVAPQSMRSTFSVLCQDQNDSVPGASNQKLCKKEDNSLVYNEYR